MRLFVYFSLLAVLALQQTSCWTATENPTFLLGVLTWPLLVVVALIIEGTLLGILLHSGSDGSVADGHTFGQFDRMRMRIGWCFYVLASVHFRVESALLLLGAALVFRLARGPGSRVVVPILLASVTGLMSAQFFRSVCQDLLRCWSGVAYAVATILLLSHALWIHFATRGTFRVATPQPRPNGDRHARRQEDKP